MKKFLFVIVSLLILLSCKGTDEEENISLDNSVFGIEQISINDSAYSLKPNSLLIEKGSNSPLVLVGSSFSLHSLGLDYAWVSSTQKLISASITSTKGNVSVTDTTTSTTKIIILTVHTASPKAQITYTISSHL